MSAYVSVCWDCSYIASSRDFERQNREPSNAVLPPASKPPRGVNEAANIHGKCAIDWVHDGHFCQRLHHEVSRNCQKCVHEAIAAFEHPYIMKPIMNPLVFSLLVKIGMSSTHQ
jgi:hypothetical protein